MLKSRLIHPPLLQALADSGHGGKILVTDSNFAFSTNVNPAAERIHLNLMPDCVTVTQVLEAVISAVPIESVDVMSTDDGTEPNIWADFRRLLPELELHANDRFAFYELALERHCCVAVATGDTRLYANILLTVGFIPPN